MPGIIPQFQFSADTIKQMAGFYNRYESPSIAPITAANSAASTGTQINAPITIDNTATINVELHGSASEEDRAKVMESFKSELDKRDQKMPAIAQKAVSDMLGNARAQQAERQ
ncbi:hypothetical protein D3C77_627820 [compost metagenome]